MVREMRRKDRQIDEERSYGILDRCEYGVLGTVSPDGRPYGVPINYAREGNKLYMHCALEGQKLDNIAFRNKCCFTVVTDNRIHQEKFATDFSSVICYGSVKVVDGAEKRHALEVIVETHHPDNIENGAVYIDAAFNACHALVFTIEEMSGKESRV